MEVRPCVKEFTATEVRGQTQCTEFSFILQLAILKGQGIAPGAGPLPALTGAAAPLEVSFGMKAPNLPRLV